MFLNAENLQEENKEPVTQICFYEYFCCLSFVLFLAIS